MLLFLVLLACRPPAPALSYDWSPARDALPDGDLHVLHVATAEFPEKFAIQGGGRRELTSPVSAYLYRHPTRGLLLIDAGYGRRTAQSPADLPGRLTARQTGLKMGIPAADQLLAAGIDPGEVENVVLTHMHMDHAAGVEDFPGAALWVAEAEWDAAQAYNLRRNYDPRPYSGREGVRLVRFGQPEPRPYAAMIDHVDLFGDGTVILLSTPGHTPGHLSVLVNLPTISYLITGDAAWLDAHWEQGQPKGYLARTFVEVDWKQGMDAVYRVDDWRRRYPNLAVLSGHEPANLARLPTFPDPLPEPEF